MAEPRTLRSSKRRKISIQTETEEAPHLSEKTTTQPNSRSSRRVKGKLQIDGNTEPAPQLLITDNPRPTVKTRAKESKTPKGTQLKSTALAAPVRRSKSRSKGLVGNDIWDVPVEDITEVEPLLNNGLKTKPDARAAAPDADSLAIAVQLQLELAKNNISGFSLARHSEGAPYAGKLKRFCETHGLQDMISSLAKFILERLNGRQLIPLKGLTSEYQSVYQLMEQTVKAGEGNSLLLLGARGCGKSTVVDTAISSLSKSHKDDFHIVRLNGLLHTDDKIALREIWHQLGREINADDDLGKVSTYADTMASLLALLSEIPADAPDTMTTTKSVIIILDEFDLFTYHPRQTLLYNLFDIAQAKKAPLAVIGLTTKVDVMENLEKRVKSRFSHRYTFLPRPQSFSDFSDICMAPFQIDNDSVDLSRKGTSDCISNMLKNPKGRLLSEQWHTYVKVSLHTMRGLSRANFIKGLWEDKLFQTHLKTIYYRTKCPKDFFTSAVIPISSLAISSSGAPDLDVPTAKSFKLDLLCPDPAPFPFAAATTASTNTISLSLSLLLAATRLTAIHDPSLNSTQTFAPLSLTFSAVYAEYVRLLTSAKASASALGARATAGRIWGKEAAREAWERLVNWGFVVPISGGSGIGDGKLTRVEVSFEEVVEVVDGMGLGGGSALGRWWRDG
ncbi:origin recognition complex subunit 4 [Ophidiomyces ophidiicola]|uniref:origin recognition complex subunit 4 n=1 Tax=Ophidiomyces ophidiicola TaxID=1387563 RepID=UPI0020C3557C|nr:origin recognition complex subunit 4 [Ophidiomyces ophidiicola]KAI1947434.1 origin recognition complex subunit 4 [Ophidiomyces ophidiicola]KAI2059769.1 origin recognition complex subunit 4 [Ophidiomyces ophidiicola]KAI2092846.1 origin recognition complex subunit 4 [Ophidiomyces ophidiicola]